MEGNETYSSALVASILPMSFNLSVNICPLIAGSEKDISSSNKPSCSNAGGMFGDYVTKKRVELCQLENFTSFDRTCSSIEYRGLSFTKHIMAPWTQKHKKKGLRY